MDFQVKLIKPKSGLKDQLITIILGKRVHYLIKDEDENSIKILVISEQETVPEEQTKLSSIISHEPIDDLFYSALNRFIFL